MAGRLVGKARVELSLDDKLTQGLKKAQSQIRAFGDNMQAIGKSLMIGGAAVLTPLLAATKQFASTGDALDKMAARTKASVENLSLLDFAATQSGESLETVERAMIQIKKRAIDASNGLSDAVRGFAAIGMESKDLTGLSVDEQFEKIGEAINAINDPVKRASAAIAFFGSKAGAKILPVIENMERLKKEARESGLEISTNQAKAAADLNDAYNKLSKTLRAVSISIGSALAQPLQKIFEILRGVTIITRQWIADNQGLVVTVAATGATLLVAGSALFGVGLAFKAAAAAAGGFAVALALVKGAFTLLLSPIGLIVAGVAIVTTALVKFTNTGGEAAQWLGRRFIDLKDDALGALNSIGQALAAGDITAAARVLWTGLQIIFQRGALAINQVWYSIEAEVMTVVDTMRGLFDGFAVGVVKIFTGLGNSIAQIFWGAVQSIGDALGSFVRLYAAVAQQLGVISQQTAIDLTVGLISLESGAGRFLSEQKASAEEFFDTMRKGAEEWSTQREASRRSAEANRPAAAAAALSDSEAALENARKEYAEARKMAAESAEKTAEEFKRLQDSVDIEDLDQSANKATAMGTFSAANIGQMFGSATSKLEDSSNETAKNTLELVRIARSSGGLSFA